MLVALAIGVDTMAEADGVCVFALRFMTAATTAQPTMMVPTTNASIYLTTLFFAPLPVCKKCNSKPRNDDCSICVHGLCF